MPATFHKPPPRHYRLGGLRINNDTAVQWASRLKGRELHPVINRFTVKKVILGKVIASRINFRQVGEVAGVHWMFVTQSAPFNGYKDMDASEIPQFEADEKDAIAQKLLEEAGIKEYEFATVLD
ncbi:hypothetical protein M378DRAFT_171776 [Amanita muscaria Koide BX008]|uniref:Uncharacterized protein n=1 Tax=Amanita muscaria (strain Koide BX008) TaxID=946122 RepID=A0A0C2S438_AMAMK|nr:hypothetical protein M378DRAFT_174056 [Amanita muscaria Koide BX008]KIL57445.1 hypothetical protein M378DRAFT_171776 [Amanita muscaria Koide BX008]